MGALADASLDAGGEVIGVIPEALLRREQAHCGLSDLRVVRSMHERKALMAELADAFIAAPGGIGTLEELVEAWTWTQLGLHVKPVALLNVAGYYDPLVCFLDRAVQEGFLSAPHRATLAVSANPVELLDMLAAARPRAAERVLGLDTA